MAVSNGEPYHRLCNLCKVLELAAIQEGTSPRDKGYLATVIGELELIKRELRGIPRLKPISYAELRERRPRRHVAITDAVETTTTTPEKEIKESIVQPDPSPVGQPTSPQREEQKR